MSDIRKAMVKMSIDKGFTAEDAEDLAQSTILTMLKKHNQVPINNPEGMCIGILRNMQRDKSRPNWYRDAIIPYGDVLDQLRFKTSDGPSNATVFENPSFAGWLNITDTERNVIVWIYRDGCTIAEVATWMGCGKSWVSKIVRRAKTKLRPYFDDTMKAV